MSAEYSTWQTLPNPFLHTTETSGAMTGRVSGRSTDILDIITGRQSAIILTGAPHIGKSTLMHYLQGSSQAEWSWRQEERINAVFQQSVLDQHHFVQVDLTTLEGTQNASELLLSLIRECARGLQNAYQLEPTSEIDSVQGLRDLLRSIGKSNPQTRCFIMLDALERLDRPDVLFPELRHSGARSPQERGIALLDYCGAMRMLVALIDEFHHFGVIFALRSLPRPKSIDQFVHVSADLARFTTNTLQTFTWQDTAGILGQSSDDFGTQWARAFLQLGGDVLLNADEQQWIGEQAGTHPYLLQQFCVHTFHFKQVYAGLHGVWTPLTEADKKQVSETVNERVTTFLTRLWKRLHEALDFASSETKNTFFEFILTINRQQRAEELPHTTWNWLGAELRYILSNEGIVRIDPFQRVIPPGDLLRSYLAQKARGNSIGSTRGFWLIIARPNQQPERLSLSELEYRLMKTLFQHPRQCTEDELMKQAWGKTIERSTFTQRMHHLRKKLKEHSEENELITNHYGGHYSLNHIDWLHLE